MAELLTVLKKHFAKKRVTIAERYKFHNRGQQAGDSAAQYAAELRHLAIHCKIGDFLNQALRDQSVCCLRDQVAQNKLLSGVDYGLGGNKMTFKDAVALAATLQTLALEVQ